MTTPLNSAVQDEEPFDVDEFVLRIGRLVREGGWAEIACIGELSRARGLFLTMAMESDVEEEEMELAVSCIEFLDALSSTNSDTPVCIQLSRFYEIESELRARYVRFEEGLDLYENLVPVFHSTIAARGLDRTKARRCRTSPVEDCRFVCPLSRRDRRADGENSFVEDGLYGFERNWKVFTEGALRSLNWYYLSI
jgi:hypothetical protein